MTHVSNLHEIFYATIEHYIALLFTLVSLECNVEARLVGAHYYPTPLV